MALKRADFSVNEDNKLLKPCWLAGDRKYSTTQFVKLFTRHEINTIDVAASCQKIRDIIDANQAKREETRKALDIPNSKLVAFKDIARLTFGVSYILRQQVSTLLDETKHLLDQVMGSDAQLACPATQLAQSQKYGSRKRKQIISQKTTTTTVCVAKRPRFEGPQLLDEQNVDYYRHLLSESQLWNNESENLRIEQSQTIEVARTCSSEHTISVTHELTLTELGEDIVWNDGFGETNQLDVTALEEFLPLRNSLKRKSPEYTPADVLSYKMPRLATNDCLVPFNNNNANAVWNPDEIKHFELEPVNSTHSAAHTQKFKLKRKIKFKIDKVIKLSRESLLRDREIIFNRLECTKRVKPQIQMKNSNAKTLLNSFRQCKLFPDRLKAQFEQTNEKLELDCENTIRSIFGADYSDALANEILSSRPTSPKLTNRFEDSEIMVIPVAESIEQHTLKTPEQQLGNNNNEYEHCLHYDDNNFDSLSIMMSLLNIWRKNPAIKSIDANNFIKSFPDRIKAALAFNHLLALSRDGFIVLSSKPASVEIDAITLGVESARLIENISNLEQ